MTERRLPVKQLIILCKSMLKRFGTSGSQLSAICRFAEPIALTSVLPYIPEMIESFGIPQNDIARWAGLTSAIFSISQGFTGIPWGAASDRFGRKPVILIGLFNTMITMMIWGFSTSLPMAITARALQGLGNGNVGILRTTVAELCPWKVCMADTMDSNVHVDMPTGIATTRVLYYAFGLHDWCCLWSGML